MKSFSPRILILDDDESICELIQLMLQRSNPDYDITFVTVSEEGLRLAAAQPFDLCVLDYRLEGITGIDVCRTLRQSYADTRIMFFTGETNNREQQKAMQAGADAYLIKPDNLKNLTETVKHLLGTNEAATVRSIPPKVYRQDVSSLSDQRASSELNSAGRITSQV
jgi:two-component system phosphate regulon response regulator PhoB